MAARKKAVAKKADASRKDGSGYQKRYEGRIAKEYTKMLGELGSMGIYTGPKGAKRFERDMKKEGFNPRGDYSKSRNASGLDNMAFMLRNRVQKSSGDLASERPGKRYRMQESARNKKRAYTKVAGAKSPQWVKKVKPKKGR